MHAAPIYSYNSVVPEPISTSAAAAEQQTPIRTNFNTPEGVYRQAMTVNEYFRSSRIPSQVAGPVCNAPVRVSFLRIPARKAAEAASADSDALPSTSSAKKYVYDDLAYCMSAAAEEGDYVERICFNIGREIYVFDYSGINGTAADSAKPVDKRVYKGTFPTCHDFNRATATLGSCLLLIGFSAGQIQLIDPCQKEQQSSKLFNEERQIDRSAVTCLRWVPDGRGMFVAAHASGNLYLYNEELESPQIAPFYQVLKQTDDFTVFGCKSKVVRNPVQRWQFGTGAINAIEFAGDSSNFLATVSQDGFLRVFNWRSMELVGCMKSYFGGLLCLAWSPDLRYIATGGEDDMLSLYSVAENRVVCRGQGHKSWVSEVAFDHFSSILNPTVDNNGGTNFMDSTLGINNRTTDETMLAQNAAVAAVSINTADSSFVNNASNNYSSASPQNRETITIVNAVNQLGHAQQQRCAYYQHPSPQQQQQLEQYQQQNGGVVGSRRAMMADSSNILMLADNQQATASNSSSGRGGEGGGNNVFKLCSPSNMLQQTTGHSQSPFAFDCNGGGGEGTDDQQHINTHSRLIYRVGSVGHDCQLCLWDISEDVLAHCSTASSSMYGRMSRTMADLALGQIVHSGGLETNPRGTTVIPIGIENALTMPGGGRNEDGKGGDTLKSEKESSAGGTSSNKNGSVSRFKRLHKRGLSLGSRLTGGDRSHRQNGASSNGTHSVDGTLRRGERASNQLFGTPQCPRIEEIPVIEPLICKKVANERLGSLHFREDCIVTACQEGYICTWARPIAHPGRQQDGRQPNLSMSDCPNDCQHMSADNFASTCV